MNIKFVYRVKALLAAVESLVLPPHCLVCDEKAQNNRDLCAECRHTLPYNVSACLCCGIPLPVAEMICGDCLRRPSPISEMRAPFLYTGAIAHLLLRFKFHQDLAAGRLLSSLLVDEFASLPIPDALVPMPLSRCRLRRRGYDQALVLSKPIARALRIPLRAALLRRHRDTLPQSELTAQERWRNVRDAFSVTVLPPPHVVLIDDVATTRATLVSAALALKKSGAQRVDAWVCARTPQ